MMKMIYWTILVLIVPSIAFDDNSQNEGSLGIIIANRSEIKRTEFGKNRHIPKGIMVVDAVPGTGLKTLDVIYAINDCKITNYDTYLQCIKGIKSGTLVLVKIKRPVENKNRIRWMGKLVRITTIDRKITKKYLAQIKQKQKDKENEIRKKAESRMTHGFRGFDWGTSKNVILKQEKNPPTTTNHETNHDVLLYEGFVSNLEAYILYNFVNNELAQGIYIFKEKHLNANLFIDDYKNVKNILTNKYGKPTTDKNVWLENTFRDKTQYLGTAILAGDLILVSTWDLTDTSITLMLKGDNFESVFFTKYTSNKYQNILEMKQQNKMRKGF